MSKSRSAQPTTLLNHSVTAVKDKSSLYFTPQAMNTKIKGENPSHAKHEISVISEFSQVFINGGNEINSERQNQPPKSTQNLRKKEKRQINTHSINPNSLMVLQVPQHQRNYGQRPSSTVIKNSEAYNQEQKYDQIMHLDPKRITVKSKQTKSTVSEIEQIQTNTKIKQKDSFVSTVHEPETNKFHMPLTKATISSYAFKRQKVLWKGLSNPQYILNSQNGTFLINAQKQSLHLNSYYSISSSRKQYSENDAGFLGYLQGNFTGSEFHLYQNRSNKSQLVATICYKSEIACSNLYRTIQIYIKNSELDGLNSQKKTLKQQYSAQENSQPNRIFKFINKKPVWSPKNQCFTMNFRGKSTLGSIKNTILVDEVSPRNEAMLFCKTNQHDFLMELRHPLTPFIAMGIVLSSFDFKLCCQ